MRAGPDSALRGRDGREPAEEQDRRDQRCEGRRRRRLSATAAAGRQKRARRAKFAPSPFGTAKTTSAATAETTRVTRRWGTVPSSIIAMHGDEFDEQVGRERFGSRGTEQHRDEGQRGERAPGRHQGAGPVLTQAAREQHARERKGQEPAGDGGRQHAQHREDGRGSRAPAVDHEEGRHGERAPQQERHAPAPQVDHHADRRDPGSRGRAPGAADEQAAIAATATAATAATVSVPATADTNGVITE